MKLRVVGIGSRLSGDDQIGLSLVENAAQETRVENLEFALWENADAATIAFELLETKVPILFADCAEMNLLPGQYRFFDETAVRRAIKFDSASTHGLGLGEGIEIARHLGFDQHIHIFAVQPFDLSPSPNLSSKMQARLPKIQRAFRTACQTMVVR